MSDNQDNRVKTEDEISNVDLQFMGSTDEKRDLHATVKAESKTAAAAHGQQGLDKEDVAVAQSMDASDPPSTNMGDAERDDSDEKAINQG